MDCTFSQPVTYDGSAPLSGVEFWQFTKENCIIAPTATPSATTIYASSSGLTYIDVASESALAKGLTGAIQVNYAFDILVLIALAIGVGTWAYSHG